MVDVYRNRWDRDVHIWDCLSLDRIVAGCITQEYLTYRILYSWIQILLTIRTRIVSSGQEVWYLVPATEPLPGKHPIGDESHPIRPSDQRVRSGHYVLKLFVHLRPGEFPVFTRNPEIIIKTYLPRNRAPSRASSSNGTPDSLSSSVARRNHSFRRDVRQRDGHCRISGTIPGWAMYTSNKITHISYTGFQAAHIFPLAFAHRDDDQAPDGETHFDSFQACWPRPADITPENAHTIADGPANGILLRADLHLFFDAYEFALLVPLDDNPVPSPPRVIRFNRSAAPLFSSNGPEGGPWQLLPPRPLPPHSLEPTIYQPASAIDRLNEDLFRQHLLYCIRLRVAGEGYIPNRKHLF